MDQLIAKRGIRPVTHSQVYECLFVRDALCVAERVKTGLAVISPHAAFAYAPKTHMAGSQMNNGIIDTPAAERARRCQAPRGLPVLRKDVERKGPLSPVDDFNSLFRAVNGKDGQDRPEDFFPHYRIVKRDVVHHGRGDLQGLFTGFPAVDDFGRVNQAADTVEVLFVDDSPVFRVGKRRVPNLTADFRDNTAD